MSVCPFADQSRRFDSSFPTQVYKGGPNKGVLHTTETTGLPGYSGGSMAPHFTVVPNLSTKTVKIYQHFDTKRPSRALVDLSGGVQTNNDGVIQIELTGTCTTSGPGLYWPNAPEWALAPVRRLLGWINDDRGIPLVGPPRGWLSYPASYGRSRVRMTPTEWDRFAGWCGHQHVPENDHGDPGDLSNLLNQEDIVATIADLKTALKDPEVLREIARFVWTGYPFGPEGAEKVGAGWSTQLDALVRIAIQAASDDLTPDQIAEAVRTAAEQTYDVKLQPKAGA